MVRYILDPVLTKEDRLDPMPWKLNIDMHVGFILGGVAN